ncbi:MAG: hypothetical protein E6K65_03085 [Nitrospirae bacterium]|nr:MAG: hypothetical protein E6K65_03085 [Nitrospirota bacterium]
MPKIDPETFRGKLYLLAVDKLVIGALMAIAFLLYDRWKTQELHSYTDAQEEVQLGFKRAEYIKQLVPIVLDSKQDVRYRAHAFGALVETKSIDANAAINFAQKLLDSNVLESDASGFATPTAEDYFLKVMLKTMPLGLPALLYEYQHIRYSRPTSHSRVERSPQDNVVVFWKRPFWETIQGYEDSKLRYQDSELEGKLLDSDTFLFKSLGTLRDIVLPITRDEADKLARRKVKGLRILGSIGLLNTSSDPRAVTQLMTEIDPTSEDPRALEVAAMIILLLPYDDDGYACTGLSDRLLAIVLRRQDLASRREHVENERIQVLNAATSYLLHCAKFQRVAERLEPTILPVVQEFSERLKRTPPGSRVASNYPVGGQSTVEDALILFLVRANRAPNPSQGSKTEGLLSVIFSLPEERLAQQSSILQDLAQEWKSERISGATGTRPNQGMQPMR